MAARKKADIVIDPAVIAVPHHGASPFGQLVRNAIQSPEAIERDELDPVTDAVVKDTVADTRLKKIYAIGMIVILSVQLLAMNIIFILVGANVLEFDDPAYLKMFMGGTLAEVFGVILVITRYLFSKNSLSSNLKAPQSLLTTKRGQ